MNNNRDFDKALAKIQVYFSALITIGSILIALGVSSLDFSSTLNLDAADKQKDIAQFLRQLSTVQGTLGEIYAIIGGLILLASIPICLYRINKLKSDKSDCISHEILKEKDDFRSDDSDEKQLQGSLENIRLQSQIEELRLEITKLKNQVELQKLNQIKHADNIRDTTRKKKPL